jgi:hypothetical protein
MRPDNIPMQADGATSRDFGEYKITNIRAVGGQVLIEGRIGNDPYAQRINRKEAILRARALNDVVKRMREKGYDYRDEYRSRQKAVAMFIEAIAEARRQDGGKYTSPKVVQAAKVMDPGSPFYIDDELVSKARGLGAVTDKELVGLREEAIKEHGEEAVKQAEKQIIVP